MRRALAPGLLLLAAACATLPRTSPEALAALEQHPAGYVAGTPRGLLPPLVLNREDFVYDARPSPDGRLVAFARLGMKSVFLTGLAPSRPPAPRFDVKVGPVEFDVEALDFSPDGAVIATACRDGLLRVFAAKDGALLAQTPIDEPLVSVAFHPRGQLVAVGGAKGLVTVRAWPGLAFVAEVRAHADEVRGLAFAPDGTLFSGGWDKQVVVLRLEAAGAPVREARVRFERKGGVTLFRGLLDDAASATFTVDERLAPVVVRGALAQAVGLEPARLADTVTLQTAQGPQLAHVARGRRLVFKGLALEGVDLAVCDACLPADAQASLGSAVLERLEVVTDGTAGEVLLRAREGATGFASAAGQTLKEVRRLGFQGHVNDVTLDAAGLRLGLALSEARAERTYDTYQREKRGEVEPFRPFDVGVIADAVSGKVLLRGEGHHGVVATAAVSPDGTALATGGWDHQLRLHGGAVVATQEYGLAVRRVRFTRDGTGLVVAAWTPQNPLGDHQTQPSATLSEVSWGDARVVAP